MNSGINSIFADIKSDELQNGFDSSQFEILKKKDLLRAIENYFIM